MRIVLEAHQLRRGAQGHKQPDNNLRPYQPGAGSHSYERVSRKYAAQREKMREGLPPFWGEVGIPKDETSAFRTASESIEFG